MRFLRVLDLENTLCFRNHHLDGIGQFHHLRYLSIRNCVYIWYLPNSIGTLSNLQTLDIKGTNILELPTIITKLRKLRKLQHLRTTGGSFVSEQKEDDTFFWNYRRIYRQRCRSWCNGGKSCSSRYLQLQSAWAALLLSPVKLFSSAQRSELGLNIHDMFDLHRSLWVYLHIEHTNGVKAPRGTGKVTSLQTLGVVNVSRGKEKVLKELSALTQLRKLGVTGISKGNQKKFWSAIAALNQLHSLTVHGDDIDGCLGGDLLPPKHLESLKLVEPLAKVPDWMHHLQSLSKLDLAVSKLDKAVDIETLGGLPNLTVLRLRMWTIEMNELHFLGSSFPSLLVLELDNWTHNPELLIFEDDAMPKLKLLQTSKYLKMEGLQFLTNLEEIRMNGEDINKLKIELEKQCAEHPNLKNVSLKLDS